MNAACSKGYRHCIAFIVGVNLLAPTIVAQASARPEPPDWYAGDAHVHRGIGCGREHEKEMLTGAQLLEMMKPNNLAVISVLSDIGNGELKYIEKDLPLMTGKDNPVSTPDRILHWDAEWHYDPDGVTFARKVIGGHLILLGLKQGGQPFAHYTYPILDWAKKNGAIGGFARLPFTLLLTASSIRSTAARLWNFQWRRPWAHPHFLWKTCTAVTPLWRPTTKS
jgi:hypothetical protein